MGTVDVEHRKHVPTLTLNRPDKRNAPDREMVLGLDAALFAASGDSDCRCAPKLHQQVEDMPLSNGVLVGKQMNSLLAASRTIARGAARRKKG